MFNLKKLNHTLYIILLLICNDAHASINFSSQDISINLNGRLLTDVAWYSHNRDLILGDGTQVRSFRIGAKGQLCEMCHYSVSVDFARANTSIRDAKLYFEPNNNLRISIGNFKPPISLEFIDSNLFITFLERSLPNTFVTPRRVGLGVDYFQQLSHKLSMTYAAGGFTEPADNLSVPSTNQEYNFSNRLNILLMNNKRCYWLYGFGFSYTRTDTENNYRDRPRPESSVTNARLVDTGLVQNVNSASLMNFEFAWQFNRLSIQGEYFYNHVSRDQERSLEFNGYYIYTSYFLTDDYRPINKKFSKHGRVLPNCRLGALEIAARLSQVDLNSGDIQGGKEQNWTLGLNWYLNQYIRFMANYINVDATKNGLTSKVHIYTLRAQFDFK